MAVLPPQIIEYLIKTFSPNVAFALLILVGFLFYFLIFGGWRIFSAYSDGNESVKKDIKKSAFKMIIFLVPALVIVYLFYRMMLETVLGYPDLQMNGNVANFLETKGILENYILVVAIVGIVVIVALWLLDRYKRKNNR